jgi:hypothetical protein
VTQTKRVQDHTFWRDYDHKVHLPAGTLDGLTIEEYEVKHDSIEHLRAVMDGRGTKEGTYTILKRDGRLWMSDTDAEWRDHSEAVWRIRKPETKRVLINGLGIGVIIKAALACDHVEHVDVVEIDERVIKLVGPHYDDPRLTIHHDDAYTIKWPVGTRWDVAWHDIWADMMEDNLELMAKLHRRYGKRVGWQGSWSKEYLLYERRRTADAFWRR